MDVADVSLAAAQTRTAEIKGLPLCVRARLPDTAASMPIYRSERVQLEN